MKASVQLVAPITKGEKTILTKANAKSYSLRTTVPKGITSQFELKDGDAIYWEMRAVGENKMQIIVTPEPVKRKVEK